MADLITAITIETLKAIVDERDLRYTQLADAKEKAISAALAAAEKAVQVAEVNSEKWRANANEWRLAMDDREALFVKKETFNSFHDGLTKDIRELKERLDVSQGRGQGYEKIWGWIVAAAGSGGVLAYLGTKLSQ